MRDEQVLEQLVTGSVNFSNDIPYSGSRPCRCREEQ